MTRLLFFIKEAFIGLKRSGLMILISFCTVTVTILIFGFFLLFTLNLNNVADFFVSKLEIRVFFREDITRRDKRDFQAMIQTFDHIRQVDFIDKASAWERLKEQYAGSHLTDYIENNPLPDTIIIRLTDKTEIKPIVNQLKSYTNIIEDIVYGGHITERIQSLAKWLKISGWSFISLLLGATLMIIINTIRLTIIARQNEIEIMQLVGATRWFIRWPFMIEGFLLGGIGTVCALSILKPLYSVSIHYIQTQAPFIPLLFEPKLLWLIYLFLFILGTVLGIVGAYVSITRTLKIY